MRMGYIERTGQTKNRTIRIDKAFDEELGREAEKENFSISGLVENIIEEYLNSERWLEKLNAVTLIPKTLEAFLEELDEDTVRKLGEKLGSVVSRDDFMMRGLPMSEDVARVLVEKILGEYCHWFTATYHYHSRPYFYLRSRMDGKWIIFIEEYLTAFYHVNLGKEIECHRVGDNLQILL
jgi:hypothetical protein